MTAVWIDANLLLRFLTNDVAEQANRARSLIRRAERGEVELVVSVVVVAEVVWVLESYYGYSRRRVADGLQPLLSADGFALEGGDDALDALALMADRGLDFADAYLLAAANRRGDAIATFDQDLKKAAMSVFAL